MGLEVSLLINITVNLLSRFDVTPIYIPFQVLRMSPPDENVSDVNAYILTTHFQPKDNIPMRRVCAILLSITMISGCTSVRSISSQDFEPIYKDFTEVITYAELASREGLDNQEKIKTFIKDYSIYADEIDKISTKFFDESKGVDPKFASSFMKASSLLSNLGKEFRAESNYVSSYVSSLSCPSTWDDSRRKEIEDCGRVGLRWAHSAARAITCTYYLVSLEFEKIPEFDIKKVKFLQNYSQKEIKSCALFKNSNSLYGFPLVVATTWIPERYQSKFLVNNQLVVVEIDKNLYTAFEDDLLTDPLYGSWNGSCVVYAKYERLLLQGGYLLGSIKNGTCY